MGFYYGGIFRDLKFTSTHMNERIVKKVLKEY